MTWQWNGIGGDAPYREPTARERLWIHDHAERLARDERSLEVKRLWAAARERLHDGLDHLRGATARPGGMS